MKRSLALGSRTNDAAGQSAVDVQGYKIVLWLWVLYLYSPVKVITYYLPMLRPLSWVPELLLWVGIVFWLRMPPQQRRGYPAYTAFLCVTVLGIAVAFVLGNWGVARGLLRQTYQFYALGLLTLTFCHTPERVRKVLGIYFGYFLYFAIWGVLSLKLSPLDPDIDPAARVIIYWHPYLDNRDAFGPLMVGGLTYSLYYLQATKGRRSRLFTNSLYLAIVTSAVGFVTSFGRGTFLGFIATAGSMWLRARRKFAVLMIALGAVLAASVVAPQLTARYWDSMQTIFTDNTERGTGADRKYLWSFAWAEFLSSPIVGVGGGNFGIAVVRVVTPEQAREAGYSMGRLWGRSLHSAPMSILSEFGLVGIIVVTVIIVDFFRTNRRTRAWAKSKASKDGVADEGLPEYIHAMALGLHSVFIGFLISGIFYEIVYTPLYWNLICLNRMLYIGSGAYAAQAVAGPRRTTRPAPAGSRQLGLGAEHTAATEPGRKLPARARVNVDRGSK